MKSALALTRSRAATRFLPFAILQIHRSLCIVDDTAMRPMGDPATQVHRGPRSGIPRLIQRIRSLCSIPSPDQRSGLRDQVEEEIGDGELAALSLGSAIPAGLSRSHMGEESILAVNSPASRVPDHLRRAASCQSTSHSLQTQVRRIR
jgi:hypothetical protein